MNQVPASNLIVSAIFALFLVTTAVGALLAVLSGRVIRSVCGLMVCCLGLAGLYWFLHSPFLAMMEILIYIGAVCVTIVFAIMLAEPDEPKQEEKPSLAFAYGGIALAAAAAIFFGLVQVGARGNWTLVTAPAIDGSIQNIGRSLLTTYSMAFELISLALLVAILGALAIARTGRSKA